MLAAGNVLAALPVFPVLAALLVLFLLHYQELLPCGRRTITHAACVPTLR
jgi:hypothetical protein